MPTPTLLAFLRQIYRLQSFNELAETICSQLPGLIAGDNVMVAKQNGIDRSLSTAVLLKPFVRMNMMPVIHETGWMAQCPMWEHLLAPRLPVRALSDLISKADWESHPLYAEVLVEDQMLDHLTLELGDCPEDFVTINVTRSRRGFSSEERDLLQLLRPHFLQAFQNARLAEELRQAGEECADRMCLPLTPHGEPVLEDPQLRRRMEMDFKLPNGLPETVSAWVRLRVMDLNQGIFQQRIAPLRHTHNGQTHRFSLVRDWSSLHNLLVICRETTPPRGLLSPREEEILHWVSEGKSNEEIGIILGIGAETVKTHLRRCYVKLGVENRTAATCAWLRQRKELKRP